MKVGTKHAVKTLSIFACCFSQSFLFTAAANAADAKPKIAIFSGPTATIQNNKPLITNKKVREQYALPLRKDAWGAVTADWPRYQRLVAPVTVYVEMFTAHPWVTQPRWLLARLRRRLGFS